MLSAFVSGVGVLGPGLANWEVATAVMCGREAYLYARTALPASTLLPAAERRRTGRSVKLALAVAREATLLGRVDPAQLASVFTSSGGDGDNCHELCQALALESPEVSPTRFSNSVHNAAAGYWSIATGAKMASNVLCAFDASFGAGLLEALVQVAVDGESVLLVAYDTEYPEPLRAVRPVPDAFGTALVLTPQRGLAATARIAVRLDEAPVDTMADSVLESLRAAIPAARSLPLLRLLALGRHGSTVLDYLDTMRLVVDVEPCV